MLYAGFFVVDLITVMNILLQWYITKQFIGPVDTDWMGEVSFANLGFLMVSLLCFLHVLYFNTYKDEGEKALGSATAPLPSSVKMPFQLYRHGWWGNGGER